MLTIENSRSDDAMLRALAGAGETPPRDGTWAFSPVVAGPATAQGAAAASSARCPLCSAQPGAAARAAQRTLCCRRRAQPAGPAALAAGYPRDVGPGVYDVHSPVVPPVADMAAKIRSFLKASQPASAPCFPRPAAPCTLRSLTDVTQSRSSCYALLLLR